MLFGGFYIAISLIGVVTFLYQENAEKDQQISTLIGDIISLNDRIWDLCDGLDRSEHFECHIEIGKDKLSIGEKYD